MNMQEKPIPITRGEEISIEDIIKKFKLKLERLSDLIKHISSECKWREELYQTELKKPNKDLNYDLLISLSQELENLNNKFNEAMKLAEEADEYLSQLKEKRRDIENLSDILKKMSELDKIIKESTPGKEE